MTQDNEIAYEWVTAAAVALVNHRRKMGGLSPVDRLPWTHAADMERDVAAATLAAVLPAIQADALRKAADRLDLPGSTATSYYPTEWNGGYREAERHIKVWLNREADRIERVSDVSYRLPPCPVPGCKAVGRAAAHHFHMLRRTDTGALEPIR